MFYSVFVRFLFFYSYINIMLSLLVYATHRVYIGKMFFVSLFLFCDAFFLFDFFFLYITFV
ncbi:hypothetical protein CLI76_06920 [Porphyromonas gingivalis]|nr:hypothetical protein CS549_08805 [Porphyromonas gingivalis]PDP47839.1 hypothetical protein CLI82_01140 [Porphyromonas gingivalis]PDP76964.1 hypothetical protein CLI76_06920 [Porphyromonas gingivalis]